MSAVLKQGQRHWTAEQRLEQSRKLRDRQIWLKSTGPRTIEGKIKSSQNARGAFYEQGKELRLICRYLRTQNHYTKLLRDTLNRADILPLHVQNIRELQLDFLENKLIDIERQIFGGLRFSDICGQNHHNIIPFPPPTNQKGT